MICGLALSADDRQRQIAARWAILYVGTRKEHRMPTCRRHRTYTAEMARRRRTQPHFPVCRVACMKGKDVCKISSSKGLSPFKWALSCARRGLALMHPCETFRPHDNSQTQQSSVTAKVSIIRAKVTARHVIMLDLSHHLLPRPARCQAVRRGRMMHVACLKHSSAVTQDVQF